MRHDYLWEILVPVSMTGFGCSCGKCRNEIPVHYHKEWDEKVLAIAGGLTVLRTAKGSWASTKDRGMTVCVEGMIPVRIMCSKKQIEQIAEITARHYRQEAVMFYMITDKVQIRNYDPFSDGEPFQPR